MTESEWATSSDPAAMLRFITENPDHANINCVRDSRKLRLFACALCRAKWDTLTPRGRHSVEAAERFADNKMAIAGILEGFVSETGCPACYKSAITAATSMVADTSRKEIAADLARCIFGNPWRPYCVAEPKYAKTLKEYRIFDMNLLTWNNGTIPRMAEAIYEARDWGAAGVLADALEEAGAGDEDCRACGGSGFFHMVVDHVDYGREGCETCHGTGRVPSPILAHLRSPGSHARGCYVIDLLTGKS